MAEEGQIPEVCVYRCVNRITPMGESEVLRGMFYLDCGEEWVTGIGGDERDFAKGIILELSYLKASIKRVRVNYEGPRSGTTMGEMIEGFFGRPAIPVASVGLRALNKTEKRRLQANLNKLKLRLGIELIV